MEFNLKRDINKTIEMVEGLRNGEDPQDIYFNKPYSSSTVNHLSLYSRINGKFDKFLGITGSMAPALNAICYGAKDVTLFDISIPVAYSAYYKIGAYLGLEYDEFIKFYFSGKDAFNYDLYTKFRDYLSTNRDIDVLKYFDVLYDYLGESDIRKHFFQTIDDADTEEKRDITLTKEKFYYVKKKLKEVNIKYLPVHIAEVPRLLNGETFDFIYLSAANEFVYGSNRIESILFHLDLLEKYKTLLSDEGTLQAAYFYAVLFMDEYKGPKSKEFYEMKSSIVEANGYQRIDVPVVEDEFGQEQTKDRAYIYQNK